MTESLERSRATISPSVYARAFGEEIVLLEFGAGEYFGLDEIGAVVWHQLERGTDLGAIAEQIAAIYDVGRDEALRDIVHLVTQLQAHHLLTLS